MNRLKNVTLISALLEKLGQNGSWCGETHIQKATYLLKELTHVPIDYEFILYKHGPFSFDLRDELTAMCADGLLEMRSRKAFYGPTLVCTQQSEGLRERYPVTLKKYEKHMNFVAENVGNKPVSELEKISTALYVIREQGCGEIMQLAQNLNVLKPHIPLEEAENAIEAVKKMLSESEDLQANAC